MKVSRLVPVAVALVAAAGAGFLALNFVQQPAPAVVAEAPDAVVREETVRVLVASEDITMGGRINEENIRWDDWPKRSVANNDDVILESNEPGALEKYRAHIAMTNVFSGEPITERKFVSADRGFMSALLPAGKRAIATDISLVTGAGGFILPNDHVDVIMTRRADPQDQASALSTETLLENVRVLAIGQTIREEEGLPVVVGKTATLELNPEQVRIVTAARAIAENLTLSLRSLSDTEQTPRSNGQYLVNQEEDLSGTVRMILGGAVSTASTQ